MWIKDVLPPCRSRCPGPVRPRGPSPPPPPLQVRLALRPRLRFQQVALESRLRLWGAAVPTTSSLASDTASERWKTDRWEQAGNKPLPVWQTVNFYDIEPVSILLEQIIAAVWSVFAVFVCLQCSSPLPGLRSREVCCRGIGKAWGLTDCSLCPEGTNTQNCR